MLVYVDIRGNQSLFEFPNPIIPPSWSCPVPKSMPVLVPFPNPCLPSSWLCRHSVDIQRTSGSYHLVSGPTGKIFNLKGTLNERKQFFVGHYVGIWGEISVPHLCSPAWIMDILWISILCRGLRCKAAFSPTFCATTLSPTFPTTPIIPRPASP